MENQSENNSLKQYYINLKKISNNALVILNGINKAFSSYSPEVSIDIEESDGQITTLRIPSFLYLENKIEELENNINSIINVPESGEVWYSKDSNMYKMNLITTSTAPQKPIITYNKEFNITDNNFFKDLVNPKTYMSFNLTNLTPNISEVLVKKIILLNDDLARSIFSNDSLITYEDYKEALYLMSEGIDYVEYDYKESLPIKSEKYDSQFKIINIQNDYTINDVSSKIEYTLNVDKLSYYDKDDHSIEYKLKIGNLLTVQNNTFNIFKITDIKEYVVENNEVLYEISVIEENGHMLLKTIDIDENMYFTLYDNVNDQIVKNVNISLEENPYVVIFISTIYNNIKSNWSDAIKLNMNDIYIYDNMKRENVSYIEYYNQYCKNIGDIIYGISDTSYDSLHSYTNSELQELTSGKTMQSMVTSTLYKNGEPVLEISAINKHLIDDELANSLANKHKEKVEINNELSNINSNIDSVYKQLIDTDFSKETSISQEYLKSQLNTYYSQRLSLQKQYIVLVSNIDLIKNDIVGYDLLKYRVRGVTNSSDYNENGTKSDFIQYLKDTYGNKCDVIGLEVEYKYKNINSNSSTLKNNSNTLFTDWVRVNNIEKQRYLKFDDNTGKYSIEFTNYDTNTNIIKWNQIDIPISSGEDVVIRIRYKYNIGQPFINLYTPWSDEYTVSYVPDDITNTTDVTQILTQNANDIINAQFMSELINGGYQEHILNKIIDNSQVYFHMPENIYSGFNTSDNKLISLKDKLQSMNNEISLYKSYIDNEVAGKHGVFLQIDNQLIELNKGTINEINVQNTNYNNNEYSMEVLNIVIKNLGETPLNLYSIFPGNNDITLLDTNLSYYKDTIGDYECVPMVLANVNNITESIQPQTLGQYIYFRQNNIWTNESYYNYLSAFASDNVQMCLEPKYKLKSSVYNYWHTASLIDGQINIDTESNTTSNDNSINTSNITLTYEHYKIENSIDSNNTSIQYPDGSILVPYLYSTKQIICDNYKNSTNQYKTINIGDSISIPLLLEYKNVNNKKFSKTISFDIKYSLMQELDNYILKINVYNNLQDE